MLYWMQRFVKILLKIHEILTKSEILETVPLARGAAKGAPEGRRRLNDFLTQDMNENGLRSMSTFYSQATDVTSRHTTLRSEGDIVTRHSTSLHFASR